MTLLITNEASNLKPKCPAIPTQHFGKANAMNGNESTNIIYSGPPAFASFPFQNILAVGPDEELYTGPSTRESRHTLL